MAKAFAREGRWSTMQQKIVWGERVPGAPYPFRVADLASLPDDSSTYEIVEGELIRMPGSGIEASEIALRLGHFLLSYVLPSGLGRVTGADGTFDLTRPGDPADTALVPDTAFVAAGRLTGRVTGYAKISPDLVAEVASPTQYHPEMNAKAKLYVERVFVIKGGSGFCPGRRVSLASETHRASPLITETRHMLSVTLPEPRGCSR